MDKRAEQKRILLKNVVLMYFFMFFCIFTIWLNTSGMEYLRKNLIVLFGVPLCIAIAYYLFQKPHLIYSTITIQNTVENKRDLQDYLCDRKANFGGFSIDCECFLLRHKFSLVKLKVSMKVTNTEIAISAPRVILEDMKRQCG